MPKLFLAEIVLGMTPTFCCTITMTLLPSLAANFFNQQGYTMVNTFTKNFKIPPASLPIIPISFLIIIVPTYDFILYLLSLTHLQLIGVGLVLSCISMAVASAIEVKRKRIAREYKMLDAVPILMPPLPISTFWLSFQYFIFGIADMFTYIYWVASVFLFRGTTRA